MADGFDRFMKGMSALQQSFADVGKIRAEEKKDKQKKLDLQTNLQNLDEALKMAGVSPERRQVVQSTGLVTGGSGMVDAVNAALSPLSKPVKDKMIELWNIRAERKAQGNWTPEDETNFKYQENAALHTNKYIQAIERGEKLEDIKAEEGARSDIRLLEYATKAEINIANLPRKHEAWFEAVRKHMDAKSAKQLKGLPPVLNKYIFPDGLNRATVEQSIKEWAIKHGLPLSQSMRNELYWAYENRDRKPADAQTMYERLQENLGFKIYFKSKGLPLPKEDEELESVNPMDVRQKLQQMQQSLPEQTEPPEDELE